MSFQIALPAHAAEINNTNIFYVSDNIDAVEICAKVPDKTLIGITSTKRHALSVHKNLI